MDRRLFLLLATLPATNATTAHALQTLQARDGVSVTASISLKEPTRIKVDGAKITYAVGNIYSLSGNCTAPSPAPGPAAPGAPAAPPAINPAGEIVVECDRDKGEIFVKPVGGATKPVNLFVSTDKATYALILKREDMPADTIVIRDRAQYQAPSADARHLPGQAPAHYSVLKSMLLAMASDRLPSDIHMEEVGRPVQLWAEARFTLMRVYESRDLVGEKYLLTNVSGQPMVLAEQEFDRDEPHVEGIAIETHNLLPGESTNVFVIRSGAQE